MQVIFKNSFQKTKPAQTLCQSPDRILMFNTSAETTPTV